MMPHLYVNKHDCPEYDISGIKPYLKIPGHLYLMGCQVDAVFDSPDIVKLLIRGNNPGEIDFMFNTKAGAQTFFEKLASFLNSCKRDNFIPIKDFKHYQQIDFTEKQRVLIPTMSDH